MSLVKTQTTKNIDKLQLQSNLEKIDKKNLETDNDKRDDINCTGDRNNGNKKKIVWDVKTIDNEFLNRKKTNCCIPALKNNKVVGGCRHHKKH